MISEMLRADGVSPQVINQIAKALKGHFDFRRAMPGHSYRLVQDAAGNPIEFRYRLSPTESFTLTRDRGDFLVGARRGRARAPLDADRGIITSTLYQSITNLGEDGSLARDFADIFAWDVDFQRAVRPGDAYPDPLRAAVPQRRRPRDLRAPGPHPGGALPGQERRAHRRLLRVGPRARRLLPGRRQLGGGRVPAWRRCATRASRSKLHLGPPPSHPEGHASAPRHRLRGVDRHPDLMAVADGGVVARSWAGGNGNLVKIKHQNGYVSSYAHLSRYADGLRVGDRVEQKQVIGYVGQTGLATGPHVCFRIQRNGKYVDPLGLRMPAGAPIAKEQVPDVPRDARSAPRRARGPAPGRRALASRAQRAEGEPRDARSPSGGYPAPRCNPSGPAASVRACAHGRPLRAMPGQSEDPLAAPALATRLDELGRELGQREAEHGEGLERARACVEALRGEVAAALERFHRAAASAGAPHLRIELSPVRIDDKHLRSVEFELCRGRYRAIITAKSRGDVTLVGPFQRRQDRGALQELSDRCPRRGPRRARELPRELPRRGRHACEPRPQGTRTLVRRIDRSARRLHPRGREAARALARRHRAREDRPLQRLVRAGTLRGRRAGSAALLERGSPRSTAGSRSTKAASRSRSRSGNASITLEPGGQFELSGAPLRTIHETCDEFHGHLALMKRACEGFDIVWLGLGINPLYGVADVP